MLPITEIQKFQRVSWLGGSGESGFRHTKFERREPSGPGSQKWREESRRRMRVENVDIQGIIKEQLIPEGWKKLGDEMPVDTCRGQTTVTAGTHTPTSEMGGEERRGETASRSTELREPLHGRVDAAGICAYKPICTLTGKQLWVY